MSLLEGMEEVETLDQQTKYFLIPPPPTLRNVLEEKAWALGFEANHDTLTFSGPELEGSNKWV